MMNNEEILKEMKCWIVSNNRKKNICFNGANGSVEFLFGEPLVGVLERINFGVPYLNIIVSRKKNDYKGYVKPVEYLFTNDLMCLSKSCGFDGDQYSCLVLKGIKNKKAIHKLLWGEEIERDALRWRIKDIDRAREKIEELYEDE